MTMCLQAPRHPVSKLVLLSGLVLLYGLTVKTWIVCFRVLVPTAIPNCPSCDTLMSSTTVDLRRLWKLLHVLTIWFRVDKWVVQPHIKPTLLTALHSPNHHPQPLVLTMQFIQYIIATFTLFSISVYAGPAHSDRITEVPREVYCGGYGALTCITHCKQAKYTTGTCETTYVNNWMIQIQHVILTGIHSIAVHAFAYVFWAITNVITSTNAWSHSPENSPNECQLL